MSEHASPRMSADVPCPAGQRSWLDEPGHRAWLHSGFADVITFALGSILPGGGFAYQAADGSPMPGTAAAALPHRSDGLHRGARGAARRPGSGELLDHAMASLDRPARRHRARRLAQRAGRGHPQDDLRPRARRARLVGGAHGRAPRGRRPARPGRRRRRDAGSGTRRPRPCSSRSPPTGPTPRTTAAPTPTCTASRRSSPWATPRAMPCGTSAGWRSPTASSTALRANAAGCCPSTSPPTGTVLPDYNRDEPLHPFRPYGATFGHSLEWSRFLLQLDASPLGRLPDRGSSRRPTA